MWQGHRDGLIIAALVFSLISFIVTSLWLILFCVFKSKLLNQIDIENFLVRCILKKSD